MKRPATTRTPIGREPIAQITPEAVAAYAKIIALIHGPATNIDAWEEDGGKRREYLDLCHTLHIELGRKPWQATVDSTIDCDEPPPWLHRAHVPDWLTAQAIRIVLNQTMAK